MHLPKNKDNLSYAKELRKNMTEEERKLWYMFLRSYKVKINKQKLIGPYIVDFYCFQAHLVIELDGGQHYDEVAMDYDRKRTEYLQSLGISVVRYTNIDINSRFRDVCEDIHKRIMERI